MCSDPEPPAANSGTVPYDAWGLREHLRSCEGFAGLFYEQTGTLVVLVTPGSFAAVRQALWQFNAGRRDIPSSRIEDADHSLRRLETLMDKMHEQHSVLQREGVEVVSYGVDDRANALLVGLGRNTAEDRTTVLSRLGASADEVVFEQAEVARPMVAGAS